MRIREKIKTINNKIEQNKAQYDLDRQAAKISDLSPVNVSKYEFLTGEDVLHEKEWVEKAATMKRFEYSLFGKELKPQIDIAKKQFQKLDNTSEFDKIIKKKEAKFKNCNKSNLIYNSKYSFYKYYRDNEKSDNLSFKSKYSFLYEFLNDLNKFNKLKTIKEITKKNKTNMHNTASE